MKVEASVSAVRREREADGYGRSFVRVLGAPHAGKRATSPPSSRESLLTEDASERFVAVSHALLVVCYYLLQRRCHFQDLGVNYFDQLNHEKLTHYFVKRLTRLGHRVTIEPCPVPA
jgi:hypothetical protein